MTYLPNSNLQVDGRIICYTTHFSKLICTNMIYKWWHRFVRKRMKPIPEDTAVVWKRRLSVVYGLFAWNAFGLVLYSVYKGKADWAHYYGIKSDEEYSTPPGQAWANTLGIKNAKVYRISGFKKVDEYDIVDGKVETKKDKEEASSEVKETEDTFE